MTEPSLEEIYARIPECLGDLPRILNLELEAEAELLYPNPSVLSLVDSCHERGIPVVLVSDMYLDGGRIRRLMAGCGIDADAFAAIMVSVDEGAYKSTGEMFRKILSSFPRLDPSEILHIGDNRSSDYEVPRSLGLQAIHYDTAHADPAGMLEFERLCHGPLFGELQSLRSLAGSLVEENSRERTSAHRVGAMVLGPFLSAFVDWVLDTCLEIEATAVAPLLREAHTLSPLLENAARARGIKIEVVPLSVSREATVLAAAEEVNDSLIDTFFTNREYFTIRNLFESLEMAEDLSRFRDFADFYLWQAHNAVTAGGGTLLEDLRRFLAEPRSRDKIRKTINRRRRLLADYLSQVLRGHEQAATVDLGFLGQIQGSLDKSLLREERALNLVHLLAWAKAPSADLLLEGTDIRGFAGSAGENSDLIDVIHRSAPILEQPLMGPQGSVRGYHRKSEGGVVAFCEDDPIGEKEHRCKAAIQQGIRTFQQLWLAFGSRQPELRREICSRKRDWCRLIHRMIELPTWEEARILGDLHNDCNFGSSKVVAICPSEEEVRIRQTGPSEFYRFLRHTSVAVWPNGAITRVDPGVILSHLTGQDPGGYFQNMLEYCDRLAADGAVRVTAYGAGAVGRAFVRAARLKKIRVVQVVDRNAALWGTFLEGAEIVSLDEAIVRKADAFAITSFAFIHEIRDSILRRYLEAQLPSPRIYMPGQVCRLPEPGVVAETSTSQRGV